MKIAMITSTNYKQKNPAFCADKVMNLPEVVAPELEEYSVQKYIKNILKYASEESEPALDNLLARVVGEEGNNDVFFNAEEDKKMQKPLYEIVNLENIKSTKEAWKTSIRKIQNESIIPQLNEIIEKANLFKTSKFIELNAKILSCTERLTAYRTMQEDLKRIIEDYQAKIHNTQVNIHNLKNVIGKFR